MGNSDSMTRIGDVELEWLLTFHSAGVFSYPFVSWMGACPQGLLIKTI